MQGRRRKKRKRPFLAEVCLCRGNSPPSSLAIFPRDQKLKKCDLWLLLMFSRANSFWSLPSWHATANRTGQSPLSKAAAEYGAECWFVCLISNTFYNSMRLLGPLQTMNDVARHPFYCLPASALLWISRQFSTTSSCFLKLLALACPFSSSLPCCFSNLSK